MFKRTQLWYSGLGKIAKVGLWSLTAVLAGSTLVAASSNPEVQRQQQESTQVQASAQEPKVETKSETLTKAVAFTSQSMEDNSLDKGKTQLKTAGVNGVMTLTYEVTYIDGKESDRKLVNEVMTQPLSNEVTAIGTYVYVAPTPTPVARSNCDPNYSPCVPNVSYDLDCPDIGFSVTVSGTDTHRFDGNDNDGQGCESY